MANEIGKVVRTGNYPDHSEDTNHQARMNRRGELLTLSNWDDMVADGNVFGVNMGTSSPNCGWSSSYAVSPKLTTVEDVPMLTPKTLPSATMSSQLLITSISPRRLPRT